MKEIKINTETMYFSLQEIMDYLGITEKMITKSIKCKSKPPKKEVIINKNWQDIIDILGGKGDMTPVNISKNTGINLYTVRSYLFRMVRKKIVESNRGVYSLCVLKNTIMDDQK